MLILKLHIQGESFGVKSVELPLTTNTSTCFQI